MPEVGTRKARHIASEVVWNGPERPPIYLLPDVTVRLGDLFRVVKIETDPDGTTYTMEHQPRRGDDRG